MARRKEVAAGKHDAEFAVIRRAQAGDREAIEQLVTKFERLIWKTARRTASLTELPEDLFQAGVVAFIELLGKFQFDRSAGLMTFMSRALPRKLWKIARESGLIRVPQLVDNDIRSHRNRVQTISGSLFDAQSGSQEESVFLVPDNTLDVDEVDIAAAMRKHLGKLCDVYQRIIRWRGEGKSTHEIARRLGKSHTWISYCEQHALAILREKLAVVAYRHCSIRLKRRRRQYRRKT